MTRGENPVDDEHTLKPQRRNVFRCEKPVSTVVDAAGDKHSLSHLALTGYVVFALLDELHVKRAFFLENEDVFVANEGEVVKKRYKVVRISLNSVVMEDTEFKQQQTLPLIEISQ